MIEDPENNPYFQRPLRLDRVFSKHQPLFFVTFNTSRRQPLLDRSEIHDAFRTFALRAHEQYGVAVGRYVLMPDHTHLFVAFPNEGITVGKWVQSLRSVLGKELLRMVSKSRIGRRASSIISCGAARVIPRSGSMSA